MGKKNLKECKWGEKIEVSLMINKILDRNENMLWAYAGDKFKEIKCLFSSDVLLKEGDVVLLKGHYGEPFKPDKVEYVKEYNIEDYLPTVKRPINDIMSELESMTKEEVTSEEGKALNDYFFKNENFVSKFKKAIGGVYNHHNYLGGLAEHTLNVMYLAKTLAYRYDIRYKEIAILGAKLHDIGKVYEMSYNGPFSYTSVGSLQGHIVMGVTMIEKAFIESGLDFSEDFKNRIKGIIVQHHGKLEYGSPIQPRTVESYVVHYADYVDATMNKLDIIGEGIGKGEWSRFDKRIEGRVLY